MGNEQLNEILHEFLLLGERNFSDNSKNKNRKVQGKLRGKNDLLAFAEFIDTGFSSPLHIQQIAEKLEKVEKGEITRLIINMPPRHGKSQMVSRIFPIWYLGKHPARTVGTASYSASVTDKLTRWQRDNMQRAEYKQIFPDVLIRDDVRSKNEYQTTAGGGGLGQGLRGSWTGTGLDLAIIDDPYKDMQEAKSEIINEQIWETFFSVMMTRLSPKGAVIVVHTRWLSDDLSGRLEKQGGWDILRLPAINEKNEALWPARYPIEILQEYRERMGETIFQALYQQTPIDVAERLFAGVTLEEPPKGLKLFAYLDPAFGGADFSALTIGGIDRYTGIIYIVEGYIWRSQIDVSYNKIEKYCKAANVQVLYLEANQSQRAMAVEFRRRNIIVKEVNNITNKHLRIVSNVKVNWKDIRFSKNVDPDYLKQILHYSEHSAHDDAPDSLSGLVECLGVGKGDITNRYSFLNMLGFKRLMR